jgi:hypothetical protein
MDLHQLKTFAAVARERSITRASEQLHLSQPATGTTASASRSAGTLKSALVSLVMPRSAGLKRQGDANQERQNRGNAARCESGSVATHCHHEAEQRYAET